MLLVFCGLPGTGKTTVANIVAKKLGGVVISTDYIRKKLFKKPTYQDWEKELVYKAMCLLAEYLSKINICILDATFTKEQYRNAIKEVAKRNKVPIYFIEFVCNEKTILQRIAGKKRKLSDADYRMHLKLKEEYEPIKFKHLVIDTSKGTNTAAMRLEEELKSLGIIKS
ncbi:MAG: AAA family ATPase [Candidatus Aenigmarchaeota archaeon]|nr:AAA family ATPase [Candidatus Aenigmarchaeota archaeon]